MGCRSWSSCSGSTRCTASALGDQSFVDHINGNFDGGGGSAFAIAGLQHPEFALLHGKFDVLHVSIVLFEGLIDAFECLIGFGKFARQEIYGFGRAYACDHVFALCVGEKFAVKCGFHPVEGSRVNATPVAQSSPMLP